MAVRRRSPVKRIVRVVESKCDGCGLCVPACPEGAIKIVDGKARVDESARDGAGACVGSRPKGALEVVEVVAAPLQSYAAPLGGSGTRGRSWPVKLELVHRSAPRGHLGLSRPSGASQLPPVARLSWPGFRGEGNSPHASAHSPHIRPCGLRASSTRGETGEYLSLSLAETYLKVPFVHVLCCSPLAIKNHLTVSLGVTL